MSYRGDGNEYARNLKELTVESNSFYKTLKYNIRPVSRSELWHEETCEYIVIFLFVSPNEPEKHC